jgi:hypothetical protein
MPPACRIEPTCSVYAAEAIEDQECFLTWRRSFFRVFQGKGQKTFFVISLCPLCLRGSGWMGGNPKFEIRNRRAATSRIAG